MLCLIVVVSDPPLLALQGLVLGFLTRLKCWRWVAIFLLQGISFNPEIRPLSPCLLLQADSFSPLSLRATVKLTHRLQKKK